MCERFCWNTHIFLICAFFVCVMLWKIHEESWLLWANVGGYWISGRALGGRNGVECLSLYLESCAGCLSSLHHLYVSLFVHVRVCSSMLVF